MQNLHCSIDNLESSERQEKMGVQKTMRESWLALHANRCHVVYVLVVTVAKENFREYLKEGNKGMRMTSASFSMLILISHGKLKSQLCFPFS